MTRILHAPLYLNYTANDNAEGVYLMRHIYIPFEVSQYVPVRCCDVVPDNAIMVRVGC